MWVPCVVKVEVTANVARRYTSSYLSCATAARSAPVRTRVRIEDARLAVTRLALLWQILSGMGFPNQFFCDFAAVPVIADGPPQRIRDKGQQHLPGERGLAHR